MTRMKLFFALLMFSSVVLIGCGKPKTEATSDSDNCVVVQTPADSTVEDLFTFKQKHQIALSNWGDDYSDSKVYKVGELEDGGSIVWNSDNVFLYLPGETKDTNIVHYKNRLQDTPISYETFKEQNNNE